MAWDAGFNGTRVSATDMIAFIFMLFFNIISSTASFIEASEVKEKQDETEQ